MSTKDEIDERRSLAWLLSPAGKNCSTCLWSTYEKGDVTITCGHHIQNFTAYSSCGAWTSPNDVDFLAMRKKRREELQARFKNHKTNGRENPKS